MHTFVKRFIVPILTERGWARVCEIGASFGESTALLAALPSVAVTVIDPCLDCDLVEKFDDISQVTVKKGLSLEVLPKLDDSFDCILIDGDHNWYTVYHELKVIADRDLLRRGGIIFLHDVEWPWGRRDMYYQPEMIPSEHRKVWERNGVVQGRSELSDRDGFSKGVPKATQEGGARNGVLTAIEDFMSEYKDEYEFSRLFGDDGLGILYRRKNSTEDLKFLSVKRKGVIYNCFTWPKRVAETIYHRAGKPIR